MCSREVKEGQKYCQHCTWTKNEECRYCRVWKHQKSNGLHEAKRAQFLTLTSLLYAFFFALLFAGLVALVFIGMAKDNPPTSISTQDAADLNALDVTPDLNSTYSNIESNINRQNSTGLAGVISQTDLALSTSSAIARSTFSTPVTATRVVSTGVNRWGLNPSFITYGFIGIFTFIILLFIGLALRNQ